MAANGIVLYSESVSAVTATNSVSLGARRTENGVNYVYVYNAGTTASVAYGVVLSANSGYTVNLASVQGDHAAGVVVHNAIKSGYYGWIATKGPVTITMDDGTGVVGCVVGNGIAISNAGTFTGIPVTAGTAGGGTSCTGLTSRCGECAVALTAMVEDAVGKVWLYKCVL
jgi:hypothetical protein